VAASISVVKMILTALEDHAEDRRLTKTEVRGVVVERWFGGVAARLDKSTWHTAWNRALKKGEVINVGGERFSLDPLGSED
jgi:hypothetical protein